MTKNYTRAEALRTPVEVLWPRFEDGAPMKLGDEIETPLRNMKVLEIMFTPYCMFFYDADHDVYSHYYGDPVKRPKRKGER